MAINEMSIADTDNNIEHASNRLHSTMNHNLCDLI